MTGPQLGSLLLAFVAVDLVLGAIAGSGQLPRTLVEPLPYGELLGMIALALTASFVLAVVPGLLLLRFRKPLAERWFSVGEGSLSFQWSPQHLLTILLIYIGVNSLIAGVVSLPVTSVVTFSVDGVMPLEKAFRFWGPLVRIAAGFALIRWAASASAALLPPSGSAAGTDAA